MVSSQTTQGEIPIPDSKDPVEEQNREFFAAIHEDRKALTAAVIVYLLWKHCIEYSALSTQIKKMND